MASRTKSMRIARVDDARHEAASEIGAGEAATRGGGQEPGKEPRTGRRNGKAKTRGKGKGKADRVADARGSRGETKALDVTRRGSSADRPALDMGLDGRDAAGWIAAHRAMLTTLRTVVAQAEALIVAHERLLDAAADRMARTDAASRTTTPVDMFSVSPVLAAMAPMQGMATAGARAWWEAAQRSQSLWLDMAALGQPGASAGGRSGKADADDTSRPGGRTRRRT